MDEKNIGYQIQWITVHEVAAHLKLSLPSVYRLLKKKNGLPAHRIGGAWRFLLHEVQEWAENR